MNKANCILKLLALYKSPKMLFIMKSVNLRQTRHLNQNRELVRPPITTKQEVWMIVKMSLKDCFHTAMSISHAFCEQTGMPVSRKTVSHRLNKEKLMARIPCHKPLISKKNQKFHLDFITEHIMWTEKPWNIVNKEEVLNML